MTLSEFMSKWNGKYLDFDGAYGAQCMDLEHQYCVEVLGIQDPAVLRAPSAKLVYVNFSSITGHELFEQIGNTPTGVPQEGDIMYWVNDPYGHVAIFIEGDTNSFRSFDQNYPTGSPCHVQNHTYTNVGGWLRFKGNNVQDQSLIDQLRADRDKNWNLYLQEQQAKINLEDAVAEKQKTIDAVTKENLDLKEKLTQAIEREKTCSGSLQGLTEAKNNCLTELSVANGLLANRKDLGKFSSTELRKELSIRTDIPWYIKLFI